MTFDENVSMLSLAFYKVIMICGPLLGLALAIGLLIGIFQAATSINEMTLTFIPKILSIVIILIYLLPWMMRTLQDYTIKVFQIIPTLGP